jgi:hypothetical protein
MQAHQTFLRAALAALAWALGVAPAAASLVDGFENGLPAGSDGPTQFGFATFQGGGGSVAIGTTNSPPSPVPGAAAGNQVLRLDVTSPNFAGLVHVFENPAVNGLAPQDWSSFGAFSFWLYGHNSGNTLYVDVLDNREPGTTGYAYEIWTSEFTDDFSGWGRVTIEFAALTRKDIANGAPNDGLGLTTVHGWAFGTLDTRGERTYYLDDVRLVSSVPVPGTLALLASGLLLITTTARKARRQGSTRSSSPPLPSVSR